MSSTPHGNSGFNLTRAILLSVLVHALLFLLSDLMPKAGNEPEPETDDAELVFQFENPLEVPLLPEVPEPEPEQAEEPAVEEPPVEPVPEEAAAEEAPAPEPPAPEVPIPVPAPEPAPQIQDDDFSILDQGRQEEEPPAELEGSPAPARLGSMEPVPEPPRSMRETAAPVPEPVPGGPRSDTSILDEGPQEEYDREEPDGTPRAALEGMEVPAGPLPVPEETTPLPREGVEGEIPEEMVEDLLEEPEPGGFEVPGTSEGLDLPDLDLAAVSGIGRFGFRTRSSKYDFSEYQKTMFFETYRNAVKQWSAMQDVLQRWVYQQTEDQIRYKREGIIEFTLHRSGQVSGVRLVQSCGITPVDRIYVNTMESLILPPLPDDYPGEGETLYLNWPR
jgi:hypothetical protein